MRHQRKTIVITLIVLPAMALHFLNFKAPYSPKEQLLQIAKEYKTYSLFTNYKADTSDNTTGRWTVQLCAPEPAHAKEKDSLHFSSASIEKSPHGDKLYKLYVKKINPYKEAIAKGQPIGQVIVKETWTVQEIDKYKAQLAGFPIKQSKNDKKWYRPVALSDLFIMYKEKPNANNDKGWVYGIVNPNKEDAVVTVNSEKSTCIGCHKGTKYDRMFGSK